MPLIEYILNLSNAFHSYSGSGNIFFSGSTIPIVIEFGLKQVKFPVGSKVYDDHMRLWEVVMIFDNGDRLIKNGTKVMRVPSSRLYSDINDVAAILGKKVYKEYQKVLDRIALDDVVQDEPDTDVLGNDLIKFPVGSTVYDEHIKQWKVIDMFDNGDRLVESGSLIRRMSQYKLFSDQNAAKKYNADKTLREYQKIIDRINANNDV